MDNSTSEQSRPDSVPRWRPPDDIAHEYDLDPSAVHRWIQKGRVLKSGERIRLQAVRLPGGWRVRQDWLDAFLAALTADQRDDSTPPPPPPPSQMATANRKRSADLERRLAEAGF